MATETSLSASLKCSLEPEAPRPVVSKQVAIMPHTCHQHSVSLTLTGLPSSGRPLVSLNTQNTLRKKGQGEAYGHPLVTNRDSLTSTPEEPRSRPQILFRHQHHGSHQAMVAVIVHPGVPDHLPLLWPPCSELPYRRVVLHSDTGRMFWL